MQNGANISAYHMIHIKIYYEHGYQLITITSSFLGREKNKFFPPHLEERLGSSLGMSRSIGKKGVISRIIKILYVGL
jgi:hypothetical protein